MPPAPTAAQLAVIDRARTAFTDDPRVLGVFLVGSHASGEADAYSDIDIHLVVTDEGAEHVRTAFGDIIERLTARPLVLADAIPGLVGGLGITDDWLHVDLVAHRLAEYDPERYEAVLPLYDRTGDLLPPARTPAPAGEPYFPGHEARLFFYFLGNLVTVLGRGEHVVAHMGITAVRDRLVAIMKAENGVRRGGGVKRLNPLLTAEQRAVLDGIPLTGGGPADVVAANRAICTEFVRRGRALAEATGGVWPQALQDATLAHLERHFGVRFDTRDDSAAGRAADAKPSGDTPVNVR